MYTMHNFYIFFTALIMALVMVPAVKKWAFDAGAVDRPGERRTHDQVVARAGGIAIFVPFMFALLVYADIDRGVRGVLAGTLVLFVTGLVDDLYQLPPRYKFLGQVLGCLVAMLVGQLYLTNIGNLFGYGDLVLPMWVAIPLTLFALVGVVNALNLIDGLDGLAAGISLIALVAFAGLALQEKNLAVLSLCAALAGGLVGFLKYNAFPARIFMGDTGSLVVGFVLGCLALMLTQSPHGELSAVLPLMILAVPIIDTLVVMSGRKLQGKSIISADHTHLHHKILKLGASHSSTVLLMHVIAFLWALVALTFRSAPDYYLFAVLVSGSLLIHAVVSVLAGKGGEDRAYFKFFEPGLSEGRWRIFGERLERPVGYLIGSLIVFYAWFAAVTLQDITVNTMIIVAVVAAGMLGLLLQLRRDASMNNLFCVLLLCPAVLIGFYAEQGGRSVMFGSLQYSTLINILFVVVMLLLAVKFVLLDSVRRVLDVPFALVLFALALTLAVVAPETDHQYRLSGILSKAMVVFIALKFIIISDRRQSLLVAAGISSAAFVLFL